MHGMGLRMVAEPENDRTQEKWELKQNKMRRRRIWWASLWESGEEDGGNKREDICGRFVYSFDLLRWRENVCAIGVLKEIGRALHARNGAARGDDAGE
jgi:hypothetical protein